MSSVSRQRRIAKLRQRRLRAGGVRSLLRTKLRQARELITSGKLDLASTAVAQAGRVLDRAASKGIIHPNNAARHKSRLVRKLNQAQA